MILARVTKINYLYQSIEFKDFVTGIVYKGSGGTYGAKLPLDFGGENGYGNPYISQSPIRVNDIVLIGFINDDINSPVVISRYLPNDDSEKMALPEMENQMANDNTNYDITNRFLQVFPDQTINAHDGNSRQEITFSGKSFLAIDPSYPHYGQVITDEGNGTPYNMLRNVYHHNGTLIEPTQLYAPTILFKHQGITTNKIAGSDEYDNHYLNYYIRNDGLTRKSIQQSDKNWLMYNQWNPSAGTYSLRRQNNSKEFNNDDANYGEIRLTDKDSIRLTSGNDEVELMDNNRFYIGNKGENWKLNLYDLIDLTNTTIPDINSNIDSLQNASSSTQANISAVNDTINLSSRELSNINSISSSTVGSSSTSNINLFSVYGSIQNQEIDDTGLLVNSTNWVSSNKMAAIRNFDYTLTAYSATQNTTIKIAYYDMSYNLISIYSTTGSSNNVSLTKQSPNNTFYMAVSVSDNSLNIKLEQGNSSTDWVPSVIDVVNNKSTIDNLVSQAQSNKSSLTTEINTISNHPYITNIQSLIVNNVIVKDNKASLTTNYNDLTDDYNHIIKLSDRYNVNIVNLTSDKKLMDADYETIIDSTSDSDATDFNIQLTKYQSELNSVISNTLNAINSVLLQAQTIQSSNEGNYTNYLLKTSSPVTMTNSGNLYEISDRMVGINNSVVLSLQYLTTDSNCSFTIDEVIYDNSGNLLSDTPMIKNLPNDKQSDTISQVINPVVPLANQQAYLYLNILSYSQPITISQAIIAESSTTDITWSAAPEDAQDDAISKVSTFTITQDQITSAVFDNLLSESAIFTETADKIDLAVTKGEITSGIEITDDKLTILGKEIDILGDIVDNSSITGVTLISPTIQSTDGLYTISSSGIAKGMTITGSAINTSNFNLSSNGLLTGQYSLNEATTVNAPTIDSGTMIINNQGINTTSTNFEDYDGSNWNNYSLNSVINPDKVDLQALTNNSITYETKITPTTIINQSSNGIIKIKDSTINSNNKLNLTASNGIASSTILNSTNSGSANVTIDASGILHKVSSSVRFKKNIQPINNLEIKSNNFLKLTPKTWNDKNDHSNNPQQYVGLIAEDLEKLGLEEFVEYDKQGKPTGIMYDRLIVLLLPTINKLIKKVGI